MNKWMQRFIQQGAISYDGKCIRILDASGLKKYLDLADRKLGETTAPKPWRVPVPRRDRPEHFGLSRRPSVPDACDPCYRPLTVARFTVFA